VLLLALLLWTMSLDPHMRNERSHTLLDELLLLLDGVVCSE
jgi:hypothetical protein